MALDVSYEIQTGPVGPSVEEYRAAAAGRYRELLETDIHERRLQEFLEENPCFLPNSRAPGSHGPMNLALVSQPELSGLRSRKPDFMWVTAHSAAWFPTLIEIERPSKRLFKRGAIPTQEFTQARNQLAQWRAWFSDSANVQRFIGEYGIPEMYTKYRKMEPRFVLVYGRRAEFENDVELSRQRAALMPAGDEILASFDQLHPDMELREAVTVRATGYGRYRVIKVMPTLQMGPMLADRLNRLEGFEEAVAGETRMSPERRAFLGSRIPYWRSWAKLEERGAIRSIDLE
ncbi:MAG TPA: Shedu immune nuclease family protein [Polyangiaceae bacterium]